VDTQLANASPLLFTTMHDPLLSIAICTCNRATLLDDALRSFAATAKPSGIAFELLVIDNNSRDRTRLVVEHWAARSEFPLRYIFEGKQGLSRARNRAVKEAVGHWVWYVDDDVYFSPGWLEGVREGMKLFPRASGLAGRVMPVFEPAQPAWLPSSALPYYGVTSFGDEPRWLGAAEYPVGANAAFRRSVFEEVGLFREDLGRSADTLFSSEETDMTIRLYARGHKVGYAPSAEVRHRIPENRATMSWLRKRAYWGGVSQVRADGTIRGSSRVALLCKAAWMVQNISRTVFQKGLGLDRQIAYAWQLGMVRQYLTEAARSGSRVLRSGS
jgi:glycosyltransferase involved in cell wall biosynthesis